MNILILLGILIIINTLVVTAWWVLGEHPYKGWSMFICGIAIFAGAILIFQGQNRPMELSNKWLGTIKAASEQATADAGVIANIKKRIEAQSATVDLVAKSAAEAQVKLKELTTITEFSKVLAAAQNDDRRAFDKLASYVDDTSFPMRKEAANVYVSIRANHGGPIEPGYMNVTWPKGVDPNKLSITDLKDIYMSSDSMYHADLVNYVQTRKDIPKKDRMELFIEVLRDDESLNATSYAGKFFAKEAGIEWRPFVIKPLLDWWEQNKDKI